LLINADVWKKLPPDLQAIVKAATWEATFRSQTITNKLNAEALKELREKHGVKIERTPEDILRKTLEAWDQIAAAESEKNPFFKKVYDSQRAYAEQVVPARRRGGPARAGPLRASAVVRHDGRRPRSICCRRESQAATRTAPSHTYAT